MLQNSADIVRPVLTFSGISFFPSFIWLLHCAFSCYSNLLICWKEIIKWKYKLKQNNIQKRNLQQLKTRRQKRTDERECGMEKNKTNQGYTTFTDKCDIAISCVCVWSDVCFSRNYCFQTHCSMKWHFRPAYSWRGDCIFKIQHKHSHGMKCCKCKLHVKVTLSWFLNTTTLKHLV